MSMKLRAVIHFLWRKHTPNQAILSELEEVYGKDVITPRAVEKWAQLLMVGAPSLLIWPDPGSIMTVERSTLIEAEGHLSQKKIAQMLGVPREKIKRILRDGLNIGKVNAEWVPHAPDSSKKGVWVQVSRELLDFLESRTD
jgi:hypothetical protein